MRRYVAAALGSPPWRVRLAVDQSFERPIAIVEAPTAGVIDHGGVDTAQSTLPITIQLFPGTEGDGSGTENKAAALRAAEKITQALLVGVVDLADPTVRGYREMVPLWNYFDAEGNPLPYDNTEASVATERTPHDYLRIASGWNFEAIPEAPDDQLYMAVAELRVSWFRNARVIPQGPPLTDVFVETVPLELDAH